MAGEKLTVKILDDARAEATAIITEGTRTAQVIFDQTASKTEQIIGKMGVDAKEQCQELKRRNELIYNLEARKAELAAKRTVIDAAFELALNTLCVIEAKRWEELITRLVLENIETGNETLRVNKADFAKYEGNLLGKIDAAVQSLGADGISAAGTNMLAKLNAALKVKGMPGNLKLDKEAANIAGGVIIVSVASETDCSFEAVVRDIRQGSEREVAKLLFEGAQV